MPSIDEISEMLKQMTEEQRLQLIHLCNIENDKCKIDKVYLQFKNNYHCLHCGSNKIKKTEHLHINIHNSFAEIAIKLTQSGQTQYFTTQKKTFHSGKNTLNYFYRV